MPQNVLLHRAHFVWQARIEKVCWYVWSSKWANCIKKFGHKFTRCFGKLDHFNVKRKILYYNEVFRLTKI
jgi:hypothetical protein